MISPPVVRSAEVAPGEDVYLGNGWMERDGVGVRRCSEESYTYSRRKKEVFPGWYFVPGKMRAQKEKTVLRGRSRSREREGTWIRKKAGRSGWSTSGPDGIFRWLKLEQGVPARTLCEANIDVGKRRTDG